MNRYRVWYWARDGPFFLRLACPYTYDLEGGLNFVGINQSPALHRK